MVLIGGGNEEGRRYLHVVVPGNMNALRSVGQEATYICDSCGEEIVVPVDISGGAHQDYVEDCPVCCHPMSLHVDIDPDGDPDCSKDLEHKLPAGILHGLLDFLAELAELKPPASAHALVHAGCIHAGAILRRGFDGERGRRQAP